MELFAAHKNWSERPADERFSSLNELHTAVAARDAISAERHVETHVYPQLHATVTDPKNLTLTTPRGTDASLTHWSSGQLLSALGIPRPFLGLLTPETATEVVNDRIQHAPDEIPNRMLLAHNGETVVRAFHGTRYERLWDSEVTGALLRLLPPGWHNPVAYDHGKWGAPLVPSGLYASDRDMFAFLIDGGDALDLGPRTKLHNGVFVSNSEVGAGSFEVTRFLFNEVCGNNIVWGATDVVAIRARHTASVRDVFSGFVSWLRRGAQLGEQDGITACVKQAMEDIFAPPVFTRDRNAEISKADPLYQRLTRLGFSRPEITGAHDAIWREEQADGNKVTGSRWDWLQGFTAVARERVNVDSRLDLESRASKAFLTVK